MFDLFFTNMILKNEILFYVIAIIVITIFIPVKSIHSIDYIYPANNKNNNNIDSLDLIDIMGATTHINSFKNLYGITLKNDKDTSIGMQIY